PRAGTAVAPAKRARPARTTHRVGVALKEEPRSNGWGRVNDRPDHEGRRRWVCLRAELVERAGRDCSRRRPENGGDRRFTHGRRSEREERRDLIRGLRKVAAGQAGQQRAGLRREQNKGGLARLQIEDSRGG